MNDRTLALYGGLVAVMAFGFALGIEYTGRMAIQTYLAPKPDWLATVQATRWVAIAAFGGLGGASAWLWGHRE